jgi:hypothetical protein
LVCAAAAGLAVGFAMVLGAACAGFFWATAGFASDLSSAASVIMPGLLLMALLCGVAGAVTGDMRPSAVGSAGRLLICTRLAPIARTHTPSMPIAAHRGLVVAGEGTVLPASLMFITAAFIQGLSAAPRGRYLFVFNAVTYLRAHVAMQS